MGKLFGTDGIRGVANETLTCDLAYRVGQAAAISLSKKGGRKPSVVIGKDTRISSDMLEAALIAGLTACGCDVVRLGVIPTPGVAYLTVNTHADAGIVISASHNPFEHNGIKMFSAEGFKLSDALEEEIESLILQTEPLPVKTHAALGQVVDGRLLMDRYLDHLASTVAPLPRMRVLIDCANGAASATAQKLFSRFDLNFDILNDMPDGININDQCGSTHLKQLSERVREGDYALGIAFDGDADRCLAVDENGEVIDGDFIMAICGLDMKSRGKLNKDCIVGTIMTNLGFVKCCEANGIHFEATKVGDRYVLEEMLLENYSFGGEQSGHVIFRDFATTGDGQLTAAQLLSILKQREAKLSSLKTVMERYPQTMVNIKVSPEGKLAFHTDPKVKKAIQQATATLNGEGRVIVRPSGTEPLLRVMVEGRDLALIEKLANDISEVIKEELV